MIIKNKHQVKNNKTQDRKFMSQEENKGIIKNFIENK